MTLRTLAGLNTLLIFLLPADQASAWENLGATLDPPFVQFNGATGEKWFTETAGGGVAWVDYDGDGDVDLYLINSASHGWDNNRRVHTNAFYENRNGSLYRRDVGLNDSGFGMGVCAGDINADGRPDLYVSNFGPDRLYLNQDGERFVDATAQYGISDNAWSTGCAFADIDGDGDHDLYVAHYVAFSQFNRRQCTAPDSARPIICTPIAFAGAPDTLWINDGGGRFTNQSKSRGLLTDSEQRGFGVIISDLDGDTDLDIYVANDGGMNSYYLNDGRGFFSDQSLISGLGFDAAGKAQAGMGLDPGDWDGDGRFDLAVSNFAYEPNNIFHNLGNSLFEEISRTTNLFKISYPSVWWGIAWADFDLDADLDLVMASGHVEEEINSMVPSMQYPQANLLLLNDAGRLSVNEAFPSEPVNVSRGVAIGDLDSDGRPDIAVNNVNATPDIWKNGHPGGHWLGVQLAERVGHPIPLNATIQLNDGNNRQWRRLHSGGSYLSQHDLRALFGFSILPKSATLIVTWPDGSVERRRIEQFDRYLEVRRSESPTGSQ